MDEHLLMQVKVRGKSHSVIWTGPGHRAAVTSVGKTSSRRGGLVATLTEARIKAYSSGFRAGVFDCFVPIIRNCEIPLPSSFHSLFGCV